MKPWKDCADFLRRVTLAGITIEYGEDHNRTDGHWHCTLSKNSEKYTFNANAWDERGAGWLGAERWIKKQKID